MTVLAWQLRHWGGRLGSFGLAALALALAGALLHWGVTVPGQARLQAALLHDAARQAAARRAPPATDPGQDRLAAQLAGLPTAGSDAIVATVAAIQQQAQERQLRFDSAAYQLAAGSDGMLERYTVSLPVQGRYPDMRAFVLGLHAAVPHLALDSIAISRPGREDGRVEAQLQFTAYFRGQP